MFQTNQELEPVFSHLLSHYDAISSRLLSSGFESTLETPLLRARLPVEQKGLITLSQLLQCSTPQEALDRGIIISKTEAFPFIYAVELLSNTFKGHKNPNSEVFQNKSAGLVRAFNPVAVGNAFTLSSWMSILALKYAASEVKVDVNWPDTTSIERALGLK